MIITSTDKHIMVRDLYNALTPKQQGYVEKGFPDWRHFTWKVLYPHWEPDNEEFIELLIELLNVLDEEIERNIVTFYI